MHNIINDFYILILLLKSELIKINQNRMNSEYVNIYEYIQKYFIE